MAAAHCSLAGRHLSLPESRAASRRHPVGLRATVEAVAQHDSAEILRQFRRQTPAQASQPALVAAMRRGASRGQEDDGPHFQPPSAPSTAQLRRLAHTLSVGLPVVRHLVSRHPELLSDQASTHEALVEQLHRLQKCTDLTMQEVVNMVARQPALLSASSHALSSQLSTMASALYLTPQHTAQLVAKQPELLEVPTGRLIVRAGHLAHLLTLPPADLTQTTRPRSHTAQPATDTDLDSNEYEEQIDTEMQKGSVLAAWGPRRSWDAPHQGAGIAPSVDHTHRHTWATNLSRGQPAAVPPSQPQRPHRGPLQGGSSERSSESSDQTSLDRYLPQHTQPSPGRVLAGLRVLARLPPSHFYELMSLPTRALTQRVLAVEAALELGTPAAAGVVIALCPQLLSQPLRATRDAWQVLRGGVLVGCTVGEQQRWLARSPGVLTLSVRELQEAYRTLQVELGLTPAHAARLVIQQPNLLKWRAGQLRVKLSELSAALCVDHTCVRRMVRGTPSLLAMSAETVAGKTKALGKMLDVDAAQLMVAREPSLLTQSVASLKPKIRGVGCALQLRRKDTLALLAVAPQLLRRRQQQLAAQLDATQLLLGWNLAERTAALLSWPGLLLVRPDHARNTLHNIQALLSQHISACDSAHEQPHPASEHITQTQYTQQDSLSHVSEQGTDSIAQAGLFGLVVEMAAAWPEVVAGRLGAGDVVAGVCALAEQLRELQTAGSRDGQQAGTVAQGAASGIGDEAMLQLIEGVWVERALRLAARRPEVLKAAVERCIMSTQQRPASDAAVSAE